MTLLDRPPPLPRPKGSTLPSLTTERLVLRPPHEDDAKSLKMLANDRRIAESTLRIPHPYTLTDAEAFIASANFPEQETAARGAAHTAARATRATARSAQRSCRMRCDILIRSGHLLDGSGAADAPADLAIRDGRIAAIGTNLASEAGRVIDASGLAVAPGFIDIKTHSDFTDQSQG